MKVVINVCFGGFSLSDRAKSLLPVRYDENGNVIDPDDVYTRGVGNDNQRADPDLVKVVETLGPLASGNCSELSIVEIPDEPGLLWHVDEYDGRERVSEDHRTWS